MAIQRAAALPAPANEIANARSTLARHYGGMAWDGPDRRVLLVRVPRADPDPVNDVEAAVEYLRPEDAKDITHCLLVGDEAVAQVYARPLQELMKQRQQFDDRTAAAWRERLPGTLAHVLFQSPEDPRRRWRLAVRIPAGSVAELDERMLEELAEGIGPELDTSRMKQVCAVYLIASNDAVRLESDMFIDQMRAAWTDEDRRRRAELAEAQKRDAQRREKEAERRRIVAEMERRLARDASRGRAAAPPWRTVQRVEPVVSPLRRAEQEGDLIVARQRRVAQQDDLLASPQRRAEPQVGAGQDAPSVRATPGVEPIAESTSTLTARRRGPSGPWASDDIAQIAQAAQEQDGQQAAAVDKLDELRQRVDRAMEAAPQEPRAHHARREKSHAHHGPGHEPRPRGMPPAQAPRSRRGRAAPRAPPERRHETASIDRVIARFGAHSGAAGRPLPAGERVAESEYVPGSGDRRRAPPGPPEEARVRESEAEETTPRSPRLAPARALLEDAGFEVIEAPSTQHTIDLAGERPEGDPQRIVVRVVDRLDPDVAKGLLKTARELDVDLVLCVADTVDPEGKRLLVATKIKVVAPGELAQLRL